MEDKIKILDYKNMYMTCNNFSLAGILSGSYHPPLKTSEFFLSKDPIAVIKKNDKKYIINNDDDCLKYFYGLYHNHNKFMVEIKDVSNVDKIVETKSMRIFEHENYTGIVKIPSEPLECESYIKKLKPKLSHMNLNIKCIFVPYVYY